jgi:hypothetical protein
VQGQAGESWRRKSEHERIVDSFFAFSKVLQSGSRRRRRLLLLIPWGELQQTVLWTELKVTEGIGKLGFCFFSKACIF